MYDVTMQLETPRLMLRQPRPVAWRSLATMAGAWAIGGFGMFSVLDKHSGEWVGRLGPWCPEGRPGTEVGWGIRRDYWGRGYATEGSIAAINWAFSELGWSEVIHAIAPDNPNSRAVARRLGSTILRSARLSEPFANIEVEIWGQTRAQWMSQRARLPLRGQS